MPPRNFGCKSTHFSLQPGCKAASWLLLLQKINKKKEVLAYRKALHLRKEDWLQTAANAR